MSGVLRATSADITTVNATDVNATDVNATSVDATPVKPGQIIEYLSRPCDGGNLVGQMGSFATQSVTGLQHAEGGYVELNGSGITYQPPPNARLVIYRYTFAYREHDTNNITHFRFYVGMDEVTDYRVTFRYDYGQGRYTFEWPIVIGELDSIANAHLLNWQAPLNLRVEMHEYSTSYEAIFHVTNHWDSGGTDVLSKPTITLIAIA